MLARLIPGRINEWCTVPREAELLHRAVTIEPEKVRIAHQVDVTSEPPESQGARSAVQSEREARKDNCDLVSGAAPPPSSPLAQHRVGEPLPIKPPLRLKGELLVLVWSDHEPVVTNNIADRNRDRTCCAGTKQKAGAEE